MTTMNITENEAISQIADIFGSNVFNDATMHERLPKNVYKKLRKAIDEGAELDHSIADIVAKQKLPDSIRNDLALHAACIAGAATVSEIETWLGKAGFEDIRVREMISSFAASGRSSKRAQ